MKILVFALLAGCGFCQVADNYDTPRCKAERLASGCGLPAVMKLVYQIVPSVVAALLSSDWQGLSDQLVQTLEHQGVQDALGVVSCAMQQISGSMSPAHSYSFHNANAVIVREHAQIWLRAHGR